jgi:hypothetical protein
MPLSLEVLSYFQGHIEKDIHYFEEVYMTDDIDVIYNSIYEESKMINLNVHLVWQKIIATKIRALA